MKWLKMKSNFTIWLTGLPCSGKTTIAKELIQHFKAYHLDGDIIRKSLCKDLGFSKLDRLENLRRVSILAKTLNDVGLNVVASFIAPYKTVRKEIRQRIEESSNFVLVYVKCSLKKCIQRDSKGMYKKAFKGEIKDFTGVSAPYEAPEKADVIVNTETLSPQQSANKILCYLYEKRLLIKKASLFIGRFSPFHNGHKYIFDSVLNNGGKIVVAIRDSRELYSSEQRKMMIEKVYANNPKVKIIVIPDIDKVCVGRGVGYQIMAVPELIQVISASKIRQEGKYANIPEEIVEMVKGFDKER